MPRVHITHPNGTPAEFAIEYNYSDPTMPPPDHEEYTIRVDENGGELEYQPDYPGPETPEWTQSFEVSEREREMLLEIVRETGVLQGEWTRVDAGTGGSEEWMTVTVGEEMVDVPSKVEADGLEELYERITALVPDAAWTTVRDRREDYIEDYYD